MSNVPAKPALSIVVVSFNTAALLEQSLTSLWDQGRAVRAEVLVVRAVRSADSDCELLRARFHECRWLDAPAEHTIPRLRSLGLGAARADIVGILEDDCIVDPGWCEAVLQVHQGPWAAVGGAVEPGPYRRVRDWVVFLYDYGRFMLPFDAGPTADLPGNNVTYKRAVLERTGILDQDGFYDVFVHKRWQREGLGVFRTPNLVVHQRNAWPISHLTVAPFHHGRGFAAERVAGQPWWRRGARALLAPFLPFLQMYRIARLTIARRRLVGRMLIALPGIALFGASWAAGEYLGYILGPGSSARRWK